MKERLQFYPSSSDLERLSTDSVNIQVSYVKIYLTLFILCALGFIIIRKIRRQITPNVDTEKGNIYILPQHQAQAKLFTKGNLEVKSRDGKLPIYFSITTIHAFMLLL